MGQRKPLQSCLWVWRRSWDPITWRWRTCSALSATCAWSSLCRSGVVLFFHSLSSYQPLFDLKSVWKIVTIFLVKPLPFQFGLRPPYDLLCRFAYGTWKPRYENVFSIQSRLSFGNLIGISRCLIALQNLSILYPYGITPICPLSVAKAFTTFYLV